MPITRTGARKSTRTTKAKRTTAKHAPMRATTHKTGSKSRAKSGAKRSMAGAARGRARTGIRKTSGARG